MFKSIITTCFIFLFTNISLAAEPQPKATDTTDRGLIDGPATTLEPMSSVTGKWKTIDDETGKEKSIVEIKEENGEIVGHVIQIFRPADQDQNPKCEKCKGDLKDKPIIGLQILKKLKKSGENKWADGEILDPNNGKTYSCKMELMENGKKLSVRGFLGFSLLGRTQTWLRAE